MFTPKRVEQLRYDIEQICHDLIFNIEPNVPFDFVEKVASVLPLSVGALVLGISSSDMSYIKRCIAGVDSAVSEVVEPGSLDDHVEKVRSSLRAFFADTAISIAAQIAVGGIGTTRALLSGIIECLDHYPLERMRLVKDRSLVPSAIEETLRWKTPGGRGFLRTATCDAYLGGRRIQAGDQVYVMLDAANRDPEAFANPETFDITCRRGNGNLSFGLGVHACIGAPLARVEAEVLLASLIQRFTDWWVVDGDRTWSYFRNGWVRLLARFDDRRL
jgi:cytochrome P450